MHLEKIMHMIQGCLEHSDLVSARRLIEENMGELQENRHILNRSVRELVDVLASMVEMGFRPLNRQEMNQIHHINMYASTFNVRGLKLSVAENPEVLLREDIHHYLNADAKVLLEGMSAI
ncbi:hypothetical protein NCCP2222_11590 [Sporosarcina sp. NCCP-2222]|uniref:hypothetical protein n=1 Tax=Sporosarcina sp. NCCP-2222 TaxID=2935073 RepID=UPI0020869C4E|nr:hypothetical protein [Sporosarcina sp. NCCP-2222]GKV55212.1 hypothetical protein NCCP2222_11590 [Sporosarcina sp. NCCP-2222]